jgi:NAD(P)H-hydrate epimerase
MITGSEMAVVDANAAGLGIPRAQLMESSGNALASRVRGMCDPGASVTLVCGRGNNGGDGLVAARFLSEYDVEVRLLGRAETITTEIARENWAALLASEIPARGVRDSTGLAAGEPDLFVDAMLGTGVSGSLREPEATAATVMNESDSPVLSADVPSGLDGDTGDLAANAVDPDHVVTFHARKPGLADLEAEVTVADIGVPDAAESFTGPGDLLRLRRDPASHKGDHGEVLVVGGGPYAGAPALTAQAALRAGADLVRVACPTSVAHEVQGYREDLIVRPVEGRQFEPGHVGQVLEFAEEQDAIVVGPGLGEDGDSLETARALLEGYSGTAVVDADALRTVPDLTTEATLVCTPHQGELVGMGGPRSDDWRERRGLVEGFAAELGHTLLVKGRYDLVSDGERTRVNRTGNPGMTVGGTGDVLAGVTGALAATQEPANAAAVGAYVTGRAGDIVAEEHGNGLLASDMVEAVPAAMRQE